MPKHDKRRVLRNLAGISGVTSTALAEVLQTVQSLPQGTDLDVSRKTIDRVYGDISRKLRLHYEILHLNQDQSSVKESSIGTHALCRICFVTFATTLRISEE